MVEYDEIGCRAYYRVRDLSDLLHPCRQASRHFPSAGVYNTLRTCHERPRNNMDVSFLKDIKDTSKMQSHHRSSRLEWHNTTSCCIYTDLYGLKLTFLHWHIVYVRKRETFHFTGLVIQIDDAQQWS